jgi:hypothetical protein
MTAEVRINATKTNFLRNAVSVNPASIGRHTEPAPENPDREVRDPKVGQKNTLAGGNPKNKALAAQHRHGRARQ